MSKLCLSTYLKVLLIYKNPQGSGQRKILNYLVNCICPKQQNIKDYEVSKIINGKKEIEGVVMDEILSNIHNPHYMEAFNSKVYQLLNPSKLDVIAKVIAYIIQNDASIKDNCIIDYVSQTSKDKLYTIKNSNEFIAGVFLYILQCTQNVHTETFSSEITVDYCEKALVKFDENTSKQNEADNSNFSIIMDSDLESQAKAFCRKYENSIELLPLCQIADVVNPAHNHVNQMYSAYCDCSKKLKRKIMDLKEYPMIQVEGEYTLYHLIGHFIDDIEKLELASSDKTNVFQEYIPKSLEFEEIEPPDINPPIFPIMPLRWLPNRTTSYLSQAVSDYLYYKNKDIRNDITLPIPVDWMWENMNFYSCPAIELVFWLNLFIASSCYDIQRENNTTPKTFIDIPNIEYAKTIEDLHFIALLMLYDTYMNQE